jgi:hypothetical protein
VVLYVTHSCESRVAGGLGRLNAQPRRDFVADEVVDEITHLFRRSFQQAQQGERCGEGAGQGVGQVRKQGPEQD